MSNNFAFADPQHHSHPSTRSTVLRAGRLRVNVAERYRTEILTNRHAELVEVWRFVIISFSKGRGTSCFANYVIAKLEGAHHILYMPARTRSPNVKFYPVTPSKWKDFEKLFGSNGACGGCWCMSWRLPPSEFHKNKGSGNKRAIKKIINSGDPPGVIGISNGDPVAWCCVGPREDFMRLQNSRTLKPIDDRPVWSIPCLFIAKKNRKANLSSKAVDAAAKYAFSKGAKIVEGYPNDTGKKKWADPFVWMGLVPSFERAGFEIVKRPSPSRAIMRRYKSPKTKLTK